jgi:hypothetical protein
MVSTACGVCTVRSPCEAGNTRGRADEREGDTDEMGEPRDVEEVLDEDIG